MLKVFGLSLAFVLSVGITSQPADYSAAHASVDDTTITMTAPVISSLASLGSTFTPFAEDETDQKDKKSFLRRICEWATGSEMACTQY